MEWGSSSIDLPILHCKLWRRPSSWLISVSMTTCSTLLAMGMMPLCLFLYSKIWVDAAAIIIPYSSIGIALVALVVPVCLGGLFNYKWPRIAKKIVKVGSIIGGILIVIIAVIGGVLYKGSWNIDPKLWVVGTLFPLCGYFFGFVLAYISNQSWSRCRTVCLETGMQNTQLCTTIIQLSFTPEQLNLMFTFPLIYSIFQILFAALIVGGYRLMLRFSGSKAENEPEAMDGEINQGLGLDDKPSNGTVFSEKKAENELKDMDGEINQGLQLDDKPSFGTVNENGPDSYEF